MKWNQLTEIRVKKYRIYNEKVIFFQTENLVHEPSFALHNKSFEAWNTSTLTRSPQKLSVDLTIDVNQTLWIIQL